MTDLSKKLVKRWGPKYHDKRDWPGYNEHLVKRGVYFLALDFVENWNQELADMNTDKRGAPYQFPKSLIELQALWHAKEIPCRMIEGMTRDLSRMGQLPGYNDYSTVSRRINDLDYCLAPPEGDNLVIFSDGTGLQAVNGGEYLREKYGKKNRQWIQIVLLGDAKTHEPVSYEINLLPASEPDSTQKQVTKLLSDGTALKSVGGDGGLDKKSLWDFLDQKGIQPIIKPDENALTDTDCLPRNQAVWERNNIGYKPWARKHGYGHRWTATEGIFSAVKRMFGEQIKATSEKGMEKEAACKIWAYQKLKRAGKKKNQEKHHKPLPIYATQQEKTVGLQEKTIEKLDEFHKDNVKRFDQVDSKFEKIMHNLERILEEMKEERMEARKSTERIISMIAQMRPYGVVREKRPAYGAAKKVKKR
jgi:hypothetical protein